MHHLAHAFIRKFIWMKPPGRKTALADVSILASQVLELQTVALLLPFAIRLIMNDWMSLNTVIFWVFIIKFCHVSVCCSLSSFVILKIVHVFTFSRIVEIPDKVLMMVTKGFIFGVSFIYPASDFFNKVHL